jgi:hypothetical protein
VEKGNRSTASRSYSLITRRYYSPDPGRRRRATR